MHYFTPLHLVVYAFLGITVLTGIWSSRKVKTFKDYTLANCSLGTGVLTITLLATIVDAGYLGRPGRACTAGPFMAFKSAPFAFLALLLIGTYLSPRLTRFQHCFTMAEMMGEMYGRAVRRFMGLLTLFISLFTVAGQIVFMGKVLAPLLGIPAQYAIWVGGGLITCYAALGGMRAVAFTDFFQFIALVVMLSVLTHVTLYHAGGLKTVLATWSTQYPAKIKFGAHLFTFSSLSSTIFRGVFCSVLAPPVVQRMLAAQNKQQVKHMFLTAAAFLPVLRLVLTFIGLGAAVLYPGLKQNMVVPHLIQQLFSLPLQGFMIAGLLAVLMSTADSFLHTAATTVVNDVRLPHRSQQGANTQTLGMVRFISFSLGIGAMLLATTTGVDRYLRYIAWAVLSPFLIPFVAGVMGLKTDKRDLLIALLFTLVGEAVGLFHFWPNRHFRLLSHLHTAWGGAMLLGTTAFFVSHYWRNGGFMGSSAHSTQQLGKALQRALPTAASLTHHLNKNVFVGQKSYVLAFFICINFMLPYFMWVENSLHDTLTLQLVLKAVGALLCAGIVARPLWSPYYRQRYYPLYWLLTATYCIPFMASFMFLLDHGSIITIFNLLLAIMLLVALLDWHSFLACSTLGGGAALGAYFLLQGPINVTLSIEEGYLLIYGVIFAILIGALFVRKTAQYAAHEVAYANTVAGAVGHELGNQTSIMGLTGGLMQAYLEQRTKVEERGGKKEYSLQVDDKAHERLVAMATDLSYAGKQVQGTIAMFKHMVRRGTGAQQKLCTLEEVAQQAIRKLPREYRQQATITIVGDKDFSATLPAEAFQHVIMNLLKNAILHGKASALTIQLAADGRTIAVQDNGTGIPLAKLPHIFQLFYTGNEQQGTGIGLTFVQEIVHAVGGNILLVENKGTGDDYTTFCITLPPTPSGN